MADDEEDKKEKDEVEEKDGAAAEGEDGAEGEEGEGTPKKRSKKKLIILIVILLVVGLGGAAAAILMTGEKAPAEGEAGAEATDAHGGEHAGDPKKVGDGIYVDLPEMLVNLNADARRSTFLKLTVSVEVATREDATRMDVLAPKVIDTFQLYLRNLRVEDLQGSAGTFRMREELLRRINAVAKPVTVKNILIKEMLVQ